MRLKKWVTAKMATIGRRNLVFAALSVAITSIVVTGFLIENRWGYSKPTPILVFMENWTLGRNAQDVAAERAREKAEAARTAKASPEELAALYKAQADARAKLAEEAAADALESDAPVPAPKAKSADTPKKPS